jgi:hypothetical protein
MRWRRVLRVPIASWMPPVGAIPTEWALYGPKRRGYDWAAAVPAAAAERPECTWVLCCGDDGIVRTGIRRASWLQSRGIAVDLGRGRAAVERAAAVEALAPGAAIRSLSMPLPQGDQRFEGPTVVRAKPGERGLRPGLAFACAEHDLAWRSPLIRRTDLRGGLSLFGVLAVAAVVVAVAARLPMLVFLLPQLLLLCLLIVAQRRLRALGVRPLFDEQDVVRHAPSDPPQLVVVGRVSP